MSDQTQQTRHAVDTVERAATSPEVEQPYEALAQMSSTLADGLTERFGAAGVPVTVNRAATMFSVFFADRPVRHFGDAKAADHERYAHFFHHMLDRGVYLPPSGYELWSISTAHDAATTERTLDAAASFAG